MLLGFVALYYGAEWLVAGAVSIAQHLRISKVVAGVVLVAFGTSAPELFVNSIAAVRDEAAFALSNVAGSNLANLLVGFGACAIISGLIVSGSKFRTDLIFFSIAPFILLIMMWIYEATLPVWTFVPLLVLFAAYLLLTRRRLRLDVDEEEHSERSIVSSVVWFILGCGLLYIGGDITVRQAIGIGEALGISHAILGLTVVALGTSIPDITASIVAARENEDAIAIGNLLGSNIFNVLFVLPVTLIFSGLSGQVALLTEPTVVASYLVVVVASVLFYLLITRRAQLSRAVGYAFLVSYITYIAFRVLNESA